MQKWQVMLVFCASFGGSAMRSLIWVVMRLSLQDVGLAAVDQAIDADGVDAVGLGVVLQQDARQVFGGLAGDHLTAVLGIEDGEVAAALEGLGGGFVADRAAHVRTERAVGHDVAVGADADRKSTRLNSSHSQISYAVFCF